MILLIRNTALKRPKKVLLKEFSFIRRCQNFRSGARIRRLTNRQEIQGNPNYRERLTRHTGQSGHGSGDSGPQWLAQPRPENHAEEKNSLPQRRGPRRFFLYFILVPL